MILTLTSLKVIQPKIYKKFLFNYVSFHFSALMTFFFSAYTTVVDVNFSNSLKLTSFSISFLYSQTVSPGQADATFESVWPGLSCTYVDLRWLALNLVEIKSTCKSTQVFHRLATQSKSLQVEWRPFVVVTTYYPMKYHLERLEMFWLRLAYTFKETVNLRVRFPTQASTRI